ncbi:MAG: hypothetical protein HYT40_01920 [Candidatus Sungbacteria bacterium]|uniref:Uncharacterized protein n=1 Tax=Candidatus Sungiibacteriota bacterium TaxID=2750080 RepID=A0A931SBJ7_9BACT|nr:hypothetical protein [Candidatus Sungbacteria bacterium]
MTSLRHWLALPPCSCGGRFLWTLSFEGWVAGCDLCGASAKSLGTTAVELKAGDPPLLPIPAECAA